MCLNQQVVSSNQRAIPFQHGSDQSIVPSRFLIPGLNLQLFGEQIQLCITLLAQGGKVIFDTKAKLSMGDGRNSDILDGFEVQATENKYGEIFQRE